MDKALLSDKDLDALQSWRDEHQDLVRSMPSPLKGIDIVCTDKHVTIRCIRNSETSLRLYLSTDSKNRGYIDMTKLPFRYEWEVVKDKVDRMDGRIPEIVLTESYKAMFTIYSSLMALMVYGAEDRLPPLAPTDTRIPAPVNPRTPASRPSAKAKSNTKPSVTYILKRYKDGDIRTAVKGSHASPHGVFSVRGHYRHYSSGKVVWVSEYKKGTGKKPRSKTYKIGGTV